ncbi:ATP-dependent protease ClpP, protease subunit [Modicisalibacter muralis]|uniref:ATP-dependent Clp protease proteolytic subunit n=1 Tax=Modicisalibacter muralis TaxID=119000 RepID=A0A1G9MUC0_9GAMM|nr:head maturation protease, ClpP-related [Halomonas muralis]SDL77882.1 ATP-dependent protease ClpP, protease subunit [Halomonas muralis]
MKWFTAKALAENPRAAHITIDGEIGRNWWSDDSVASSDFMREVKALGELDEITIDINSPGGAVTDGITIANYLRSHSANVTVNVLGQASSIASVIAAAGDQVNMGLGSWMMVHQPWTVTLGNADDLRALAGDLDKITDGIMVNYLARVGEDKREEMLALIKGGDGDGTILNAEEAVALGLADTVMVETKAAASMAGLAKAMAHGAEQARAKIQSQSDQAQAMNARDALALAFDITPGEVDEQAADLGDRIVALRAAPTLASLREAHPGLIEQIETQAKATVELPEQTQAAVTAERDRVVAIVKACQTTGQPQLLDKLIGNGMTEAQASEYIYDVAAASGNKHAINGNHSPEGGHRAGIDHNAIYARLNRKTPA